MLKLFRTESLWRRSSNKKKDLIREVGANCNTKNDYSQFIPAPFLCINTIEDISDKCIIEILKRVDCKDILNMRLVNKRINKIIRRHFTEFNIKKIDEIILVGCGEDKCYRLNESIFLLSPEERRKFSVSIKNISIWVRYIMITQTVSIESLNFSQSFHKTLRRMCESSVHELLLTDCVISINYEIFSSLIRTLYLSKVVIKRCVLEDCQLLSDHLFTLNLQLKVFKFYGINKKGDCIYAPLLSNKTLATWAESASWPEIILLQGVKSNITHYGIKYLLETFHEYSCMIEKNNIKNEVLKSTHSFYWDLGFIRCQLSQLVAVIRNYNRWISYIKRNSEQISFVYRYSNTTQALVFNIYIYT
uniref:F-box domain-containing protein n=1 Tax=Strongyloides venezuelensis TaxID=75913 RepID=A0A0K0FYL9_STRVS